jgi:hypothetical protein
MHLYVAPFAWIFEIPLWLLSISNSTGISGRVNKIVGTPTREILFVLFSKGMVHSHEFKNENLSKYTI